MANDLLNPPETETTGASQNGREHGVYTPPQPYAETGHELDAFLGKAFEEKSAWSSLYDSVHEIFFPTKLPPLELTSTPIPVIDPMAEKRSPVAWIIAAAANVGLILLLLFAFRKEINKVLPKQLQLTSLDVPAYQPKTPKNPKPVGGGGGGGDHSLTPASKGKLPKFDPKPIVPPMIAKIDHPTLAVDPKIDVQPNLKLPDNPNLPNFGATQGPSVVLSNGTGSNGIGNGKGGGVGSGSGNGYGPGSGGNTGGGPRQIGNGVSEPKLIYSVEAEFSDEARRAKYEGTVVVSLIVDANGNPQNIRVSRSLGMGLDEKAVEAVKQYRFKPSIDSKTGKPVPVMLNIEVRFRLY